MSAGTSIPGDVLSIIGSTLRTSTAAFCARAFNRLHLSAQQNRFNMAHVVVQLFNPERHFCNQHHLLN